MAGADDNPVLLDLVADMLQCAQRMEAILGDVRDLFLRVAAGDEVLHASVARNLAVDIEGTREAAARMVSLYKFASGQDDTPPARVM